MVYTREVNIWQSNIKLEIQNRLTSISFTGSNQISWEQLDNQGITGEATWDNQAFKDQNAVEASTDFVESLESSGTTGVIGGDGNETANDGGIDGDYFQDPLSS